MQNQDPQGTEPPADAPQPAAPAPQLHTAGPLPVAQSPVEPLPYGPPPSGQTPVEPLPYGPPPYAQSPVEPLPYGPPPYGQTPVGQPPYGQPDWAATQGSAVPARTNGFAIASLVIGGLGGILLSVIFGLIALRQIDQRDEKGRGLAIGGLALSGFWVLVAVAIFVFVPSASEPAPNPALDQVRSKVLAPGDCLAADLEDVLPCTEPHAGEVYTVFTLPSGPYPGEAEVEAEAEKRCVRSFEPYAEAASEDMELHYLGPSARSWLLSRTITCIAADPSGALTGPLVK